MTVVSMNYLLEAGVHFGHQKRRWNPKMKEYIFSTRDDIYIIDLQKTAKKIEEAYEEVKKIAENGGKFLFVGTRKQAQEAAEESAVRTNMFFVNERWLGGTLTNFRTIKQRVRRLEEIEKQEKDGTFELLPKKEVIKIRKEYDKLNKYLRGIREMKKMPEALIIVDPTKEANAIKEARILGIKVFGIVDTNCDPDMVDYVIPGNDDAVRAVKLMIGVLANAIAEVNGNEIIDYVSDEDRVKTDKKQKEVKVEKEVEEVKEDKKAKKEVKKVEKEEKPVKKEEKKETVKETKTTAKKEIKEVKTVKKEEKAEKKTTKKVEKDLSKLTVAELKEMAKKKKIEGYTSMKKAGLVAALEK